MTGAGNVTTGRAYHYTTSSLPTGGHYIQLEFNDGSGLQDFQEREMAVTLILAARREGKPGFWQHVYRLHFLHRVSRA